jgi:F-type H+-transporting ATPase subunit delta
MSAEKLSKRYAKALFDESVSSGSLDAIYADLGLIDSTLKSSRELKAVFKSPVIKNHKKQTIISQIFDGKVNTLTQKFLQLIIQESRDNFISEIIASFFKLYNETKGISEVTVTTATELDNASEQKIVSFIKATSGYPNVKINKKIDTSILGGFVVDFGGKLYDNSVRYKLRKIEKEISLN